MHCGVEGAELILSKTLSSGRFFKSPGCSDMEWRIRVRVVFSFACQNITCYTMLTCGGAGGDGGGGGAVPRGHSLQPVGSRYILEPLNPIGFPC